MIMFAFQGKCDTFLLYAVNIDVIENKMSDCMFKRFMTPAMELHAQTLILV